MVSAVAQINHLLNGRQQKDEVWFLAATEPRHGRRHNIISLKMATIKANLMFAKPKDKLPQGPLLGSV